MSRSTATIAPERGPARPALRSRSAGIAACLLFVLGLAVPAGWEHLLRTGLEDPPRIGLSTEAVDRDGHMLRVFMAADQRWRLPVDRSGVDPRFVDLLIGAEDKRFYRHHGVDGLALLRASVQMARRGRIVSGGSTLTMQVARLLEPRRARAFGPKLRQMLRAAWLERRLDKAAILDRYLELAPYGGNLQGIRAASLAYLGHEPRRLSLAEAALLVALPQSPETRRPDRFPDRARAARDRVIERAVQDGRLTRDDADQAEAEPVPRLRRPFPALAPQATAMARAGEPGRQRVRMTLDAGLQRGLEALVRSNAVRYGPAVSGAMLVIDNLSGDVLAHVGSADPRSVPRSGALDMTMALRSPGSTLKPFIYALAFENGLASPETVLEDRPTHFGTYAPENFDQTYRGSVSARAALQLSLNLPAVALLDRLGPARLLARLREAGADVDVPSETAPGLAVGLGGLGIRLVDLARLYAGLARGGDVPVLRESFGARPGVRPRPVAEPVSSWYVADILRGAPPPANALGGRIAFKTGTSYGYRDALAIGFSRRYTIAAWLGRPDNAAVPGLVGRQAAAPMLFDAFARLGGPIEAVPPPLGATLLAARDLPVPLRRLGGRTEAGPGRVRISYPPDRGTVDLGLAVEPSRLALKVEGGEPPFTWFVNGVPSGPASPRRQDGWMPDGQGFARISVTDARGTSDSVSVRLR